jgi:prephenate dehydratase
VTELTASDISAEKISQFVQAYRQVIALIEQREPELRSAETQAEALQIEQDIETAAIATIEAAGLTGPEYLQLLGLANTDAELSQRIVTQLEEAE